MILCTYVWIHIPTGKRGVITQEYLEVDSYYRDVIRWNKQQPKTWAYCPLTEERKPSGR
jgi:hypothetical protein